ncbi:MAG: putative sugar nucleotidyl transferase [Phycisphaeraceae bacterium]
MSSTRLLIIDNQHHGLAPLTHLRPSFDLRTGAWTTRQRIERVLGLEAAALFVWGPHWGLVKETQGVAGVQLIDSLTDTVSAGRWYVVGSGCASPQVLEQLKSLAPQHVIREPCGAWVAAHLELPRETELAWLWDDERWNAKAVILDHSVLVRQPWHILGQLEATLAYDLAHMTRRADSAAVHASAVIDETRGPVVIDHGAIVGALSFLQGPCYIGAHTEVAPHAYIRPHTVVGPYCKVAGEISFSIIQGYTNKAHQGYLGHSLLGQWVNLGAGTTVSNLKNTYGSVRVQRRLDEPEEDTGRQFCGPIIGDYVRTAIGSRLLTGACLNTGAMIALSGFAPKCARTLGFYTDEHPEGQAYDLAKFVETARAMMARREVDLGPELEGRLRELATE